MDRKTILRLSLVVALGATALLGGFTLTGSPARPAFVDLVLASAPSEAWGIPTSEIAGRKFELVDKDHWVEKGVRFDDRAYARIDTRSPEGQAFVRRYDNLDTLLSGGSTVVMVDEDTMTLVELSAGQS
ncbi:MAG TPA: hypothetical protein VHN15_14570 [Thermoanaerobaculia bacterium]|nr:hypothetical protein [Thermoanaerobaculia bacterium]